LRRHEDTAKNQTERDDNEKKTDNTQPSLKPLTVIHYWLLAGKGPAGAL